MSLKLTSTVAILLVAWSSVANAGETPIPTCHGTDARAGATARAEGLKHYRLSRREGASDPEMMAALSFFDASCAAGDESVLELRAYALAGLGRFVEAAESLDVFLASHPLYSLESDVRDRIAKQQPEILSRIASLTIESTPAGATVSANHRDLGKAPLTDVRLAPATYELVLSLDGHVSQARSLELSAGSRTDERIELARAAAGTDLRPVEVPRPRRTDEPPSRPSSLRPWAVGTAIGAASLLVVGIAATVWAENRSSAYDSNGCGSRTKAGCDATRSEFNVANGIQIGSFVGAGLAAAGAAVLFYLDTQAGSRSQSLRCGAALAFLTCNGTF